MNFCIKKKIEKLWMLNFMTDNYDCFKIYFVFLQKCEQIYLSMKGKLTGKYLLFPYFFQSLAWMSPKGFFDWSLYIIFWWLELLVPLLQSKMSRDKGQIQGCRQSL